MLCGAMRALVFVTPLLIIGCGYRGGLVLCGTVGDNCSCDAFLITEPIQNDSISDASCVNV